MKDTALSYAILGARPQPEGVLVAKGLWEAQLRWGMADLCSLEVLLVGTRRSRREAMLLPWKPAWRAAGMKLHRGALC